MNPDHYYWFYSTVAQSLAALIGIIGVFAVFRLQAVHNHLEKDSASLLYFIKEYITVIGGVSHLSIEKLFAILKHQINEWKKYIKDRKDWINDQNKIITEIKAQEDGETEMAQRKIKGHEKTINQYNKQKIEPEAKITEANQKINNIESRQKYLERFKSATGALMMFFIVIFVWSISALSNSDIFFTLWWLDIFVKILTLAAVGLILYIYKSILQ